MHEEEIIPIRNIASRYDGECLDGSAFLFEFRGERYLWAAFDCGMFLYVNGGEYPRSRIEYRLPVPILKLWSIPSETDTVGESFSRPGLRMYTHSLTDDQRILAGMAANGTLDRLSGVEANRAFHEKWDEIAAREAGLDRAVEDVMISGSN